MKFFVNRKKKAAWLLLLVMIVELIAPNMAYALTSGPSQPETQGFQPIGNSDMVDLFSGDFSYNIPLMDVGGYPVNLAYHSGASMDDESSWVGYGWGLNVGSLNRQMRGIPDDFNGTDEQEREMNIKDHTTIGGKFSVALDAIGIPVKKAKAGKKGRGANLSLTFSLGIKNDNYRGIGMETGVNAGLSLSTYAATGNNSSETDTTTSPLSGGIGLNLSSQDGATFNLNASILSNKIAFDDKSAGLSSSIGFGYNTRSGLQGMTLGSTYNVSKFDAKEKKYKSLWSDGKSSYISFNGNSYTPTIDHPMMNNSYSFSFQIGAELWIPYISLGATGFYSSQSVADRIRRSPSYGFLHSEKAKDENEALTDFNREKDIPYTGEVKYLPIPVPTYDLFSASSQDGSGQYHLYRGSSGVFGDQKTENKNLDLSLGIELGVGTWFDIGADIYAQTVKSITQKWRDRNHFLPKGDFQGLSAQHPTYEPAYFKRVGEPVPYDNEYVAAIKGTGPVAVKLPKNISDAVEGAEASDRLRTKANDGGESINALRRNKREVRNTTFSYLTGFEAFRHGLDKTIKDYHPDSLVLNDCNTGGVRNSFQRVGDYRKSHHFSEITVTGDDGKRSVYGLPVYNTYQEEVSFSVPENLALRNKGLINYQDGSDNSLGNTHGRENYFSREKMPAYATSYLLTAILSPDYVDATGNGVTDDDMGTAVKFNYSKLNSLYKWRTPYAFGQDTANYNEGFLSDAKDDKANYVYGEKEIWYMHSIESKTMVAHFITEDRDDGLGVQSSRGKADTTTRLKRLKEIRLYSKSDLVQNDNDPSKTIPIKVVHFEYDYSLFKGLPNNINTYRTGGDYNNTGKLTLKRVYFTFGQNQKGRLNPYDFQYDTSYNSYAFRQYDRWSNFKDVAHNPEGLNNSEFPYTLQDAVTDEFVSAWQLKKIILPSGGSINIIYESDDYGYVQDRRAMQMCMVNGIGTEGVNTGLIGADYILVNLPFHVANRKEMLRRYFEGITNLYYKFLVDLDGKGHSEFVPGYAEIVGEPELVGPDIAKIRLRKIKSTNPITKAGWQFIRTNLPKYAYPGSDNLDDQGSSMKKQIQALVTAFGNVKELITGFEKRARNKNYSDKVDLSKSWVRLCSPEWKKKGGGSRVKRVDISDDWENMSGASGAQTATYSQVYDYTTTNAQKDIISSGVASYEPLLGNDENPFRLPIRYKQSQFLALNNYYYIEEPFGESFFPAANVGYSKVTVKTIGSGDEASVNRTGVTVSEFFTAKDYPTKIDILGLEHRKPAFSKLFKLIGGVSLDVTGVSQGYSIELNDMHGKPKTVNIYNKAGQNISSVEYFYKSVNEKAEKKTLRNDVKVVNADGTVTDGTIGMDVEFFTDMRQATTANLGVSAKISGGSGAILFWPLPFFFPGIGVNYDRRSFRSSSSIKIINRFAIQYKVKKTESGSSITSENLAWDAETGNVLLTKTQNEFEDPVYSFAYPAHWKYDGMGQAYRNLGTFLLGLTSNANGVINSASPYYDMLVPGDELIDILFGGKYWVIQTDNQKRLINAEGELQQVGGINILKLIRSGRRNMANTAIATISSLNNPIVGNTINVSQLTKILDAKATVFSEEWSMPVFKDCAVPTCPDGCMLSGDSTFCFSANYVHPIPATTSDFDSVCARTNSENSIIGSFIYTTFFQNGTFIDTPTQINTGNPLWIRQNSVNIGPMNRSAVWECNTNGPGTTWRGFTTVINVPVTATYLIGIGGDNQVQIIVDADTIVSQDMNQISAQWGSSDRTFKIWHIFPVELAAGQRTIRLNGWNEDGTSPVGFGAEIYDHTADQLAAITNYDSLNIVFSSRDFRGMAFDSGQFTTPICPDGFTLDTITGMCISDTTICPIMMGDSTIINPYTNGILGNWRPKSQYVYQVNRENFAGNPAVKGSTNIRKSGAYSIFNPFWSYAEEAWNQSTDPRWIAANEVTYFNRKGLELENRDALNRYSSALFGYLESMPVAVASNSRYREIAYDGFEDYGFVLDCADADTCNRAGHFDFRKNLNGSTVDTTSLYSHSGKYSLELNGSTTLTKTVYTGDPFSIFNIDNLGRYVLSGNELAKGFSPIPGKQYVLSFWVKDDSPRDPTTDVQAIVNGMNLIDGVSRWPIVEGWKRVEVPFLLSESATNFNIQLQSGGGTVYIDDIRIHPYDGQMKTFAYDPSTQRLMAELDENNFAAFYEYDDEGTLIRVKKETERGIMTIKETRSGYRKRQ